MNSDSFYQSPFSTRYASKEMSALFSDRHRYITWRKLWIELAKAEKALGLSISDQQIRSMEAHINELDLNLVSDYEKKFKHDVMAHLHAFGDLCPDAKGIIHLGATSCFVTDNTDLILLKEGLKLLHAKVLQAIRHLADFAKKNAGLSCLSFTHFQAAQPSTYGKRACLWLQDLLMDLHDLEEKMHSLRFLGVKGATGTQASFLSLFEQDHSKVKKLERAVAKAMGFELIIPVSGQTYTRKQDIRVIGALSSFAATTHKIATDIRLLAHLKELEEPFGKEQVGSSAMPYKKNPMRSERICGLARFLISLNENPLYTHSTQWLERSLDDSANRRLAIPEAFLCADSIINLLIHIFSGIVLHPHVIKKNMQKELPFMATENILMLSTKKGKDRQKLHESLRRYSIESSSANINDEPAKELLHLILQDKDFDLSQDELNDLMEEKKFTGRAEEQVYEFLSEEVEPILKKFENTASYKPLVFV
jgi:adenylosuccinate lyase